MYIVIHSLYMYMTVAIKSTQQCAKKVLFNSIGPSGFETDFVCHYQRPVKFLGNIFGKLFKFQYSER